MQEQTRELSQSVAEEPIPSVAENAAVEVDATLRERELTARVVLPKNAEVDTDEEEAIEEEERGGANGDDLLEHFPDDTEDLELLHSRIGSLDTLSLSRFAGHLKRLCLRQNSISFLDPAVFHQLTLLEELDLYDNKLKSIGNALEKCSNLKVLDLSFNLIKHVPEGLEHLMSLDTIYFVQNKIGKISGLSRCPTLRSLELGGNRIRKIEGLENLMNLEELWLGKNKITKLEGLQNLKKLKILSMQSNRTTKLEGLEDLEELDQLYLSHNGIEKMEGLEKNTRITTLDLGANFITQIENISHLSQLEELWISGNRIPDFSALETELKSITTLRTLYLEMNPCQESDRTNYRRKVMLSLPQLTQIDALYTRGALNN